VYSVENVWVSDEVPNGIVCYVAWHIDSRGVHLRAFNIFSGAYYGIHDGAYNLQSKIVPLNKDGAMKKSKYAYGLVKTDMTLQDLKNIHSELNL